MRTKIILLSCFFSLVCSAAFSQRQCDLLNLGSDNYQNFFFNNFYYDDFSYRFASSPSTVNHSFGKRISMPSKSVLCLNDTSLLDSLRALSNIYLVLGSRKNQALQLENLQRIGKSTFLYFNYNSVASLGFVKNSVSRNRSFDFKVSHSSRIYKLNGDFLILSNYDALNGGINDSGIPSNYSKRDLLQQNVNLNNDYLSKRFYNIDVKHQFSLFSSLNGNNQISLALQNNYSRFGFLYAGDGYNEFYQNVFYDSSATIDTCGYKWLANSLGIKTKFNSIQFSLNAINEIFAFQLLDSVYNFNDWSVKADFIVERKQSQLKGSYSNNISDNFRRNNANAKVEFLYRFNNNSIFNCIEFQSEYNSTNVPFAYQKQFSNHYVWNLVTNLPMEQFSNIVTIGVGSNLFFKASSTSYNNRVYLNDNIVPEVTTNRENLYSFQLNYNDTIGKVHIVESAIYNTSNSSSFPVIPIQSFTRVGYMFSLFKDNLKVEAGLSGIYNDAWFATSYSPALDDFYLQSEKKFGGLTVLNVFADFKIKSATLFLKVERLNIGWFKENSFIRDGYLAPPRTVRFGFNWPLTN